VPTGSASPSALAGVAFIAICQIIDLLRFRHRGLLVMGQVVELERIRFRRSGWVYKPIIEYRIGSDSFRIKPPIAMYPSLYDVGQSVPVYYFADLPSNARLITPREFIKWFLVLTTCLFILGLLLAS
jgi:hypothetical protein